MQYSNIINDVSLPSFFKGAKAEYNFEKILKEFKDLQNLNFLEIGCFAGESTLWMLNNILTSIDSKITCVDAWSFCNVPADLNAKITIQDVENLFDINTKPFGNKVIKCKSNSKDWLINNRDKRYDFIYIDADHQAISVISDAVLAWDLLKVGGIMAFDDYLYIRPDYIGDKFNPKIAIDGFLKILDNDAEILYKGWQLWIRKISDAKPSLSI